MTYQEFIAIDGDDIGTQLRSHIIANDIEMASKFSKAITSYFVLLGTILETKNYQIVFCGGDSLLAVTNSYNNLPYQELPNGPCNISIGIGGSAEYAYLALQLAKARGKKQVVKIAISNISTVYKWD